MSLTFTVLLWLHVVSAIGWLGAAMVFGMLIGPTLPTLTPASRGELVVKLFPKYVRYLATFILITPIFGLLLVLDMGNGSMSLMNPSTTFGMYISAGAFLTLILWILGFGLIVPTTGKIVRLTKDAMSGSGPPSPDLLKASARLRALAIVGLIILFVIVFCMVAAATG